MNQQSQCRKGEFDDKAYDNYTEVCGLRFTFVCRGLDGLLCRYVCNCSLGRRQIANDYQQYKRNCLNRAFERIEVKMIHETTSTGTIVTVFAVVGFVSILIMLVIVLDHKARIPGNLRRDVFQITGVRRNHPIWSYLIGFVLLTIIGGIGLELGATMLHYVPIIEEEKPSVLLDSLKEKSILESKRHFHNPANTLALEGKKSVCYYCHGDFPHFQRRMIRTILNMHTQFIGCMTCHANKDKVDESKITLKWLNFSGIDVEGPRFGVDYNPETGFLIETEDFYSKIVAYLNDKGSEKLLEITEDDPMAIDFVKVQEKLKGRDRESVKKSLHNMVMPKGRFCPRCHTQVEKSFVPFKELGFSDERIHDLTNMNIIGIVEKYKEFYMPNLMNREVDPIKIETPSDTILYDVKANIDK